MFVFLFIGGGVSLFFLFIDFYLWRAVFKNNKLACLYVYDRPVEALSASVQLSAAVRTHFWWLFWDFNVHEDLVLTDVCRHRADVFMQTDSSGQRFHSDGQQGEPHTLCALISNLSCFCLHVWIQAERRRPATVTGCNCPTAGSDCFLLLTFINRSEICRQLQRTWCAFSRLSLVLFGYQRASSRLQSQI